MVAAGAAEDMSCCNECSRGALDSEGSAIVAAAAAATTHTFGRVAGASVLSSVLREYEVLWSLKLTAHLHCQPGICQN